MRLPSKYGPVGQVIFALAVIGFAFLAGFVIRFNLATGPFSDPMPAFNTVNCRVVPGVVGPEHVDIVDDVAYISGDEREWLVAGVPLEKALRSTKGQGSLSYYRYKDSAASITPLRLVDYFDHFADFHPVGFDVVESGDDTFILTTNWRRGGGFVTIFRVNLNDNTATFVKDLKTGHLNGLTAVSINEFYGTNMASSEFGTTGYTLEMLTLRPWGGVLRCAGYDLSDPRSDAAHCKFVVPSGIRLSNGIAMNEARSEVYVAGSLDRAVTVYTRDTYDGSLALTATVPVGVIADNLFVAEDGSILVAGSNSFFKQNKHFEDPEINSTSIAVRVARPQSGSWADAKAERIFSDPGTLFSAATVATFRDGHLLLGTIRRDGILHCEGKTLAAPAEQSAGPSSDDDDP